LPTGDAAPALPILLRAQSMQGEAGKNASASGNVELRRGGVVIRADQLDYDVLTDTAKAQGRVQINRAGAVYSGPALELGVQSFEGFFMQPRFEFPALGAGGQAERFDFLGPDRGRASNASYTSCPRDDTQEPAWVLTARSVSFDTQANEGIAEGARLRFLGTTILALPTLSFPLNDARKSGWLPPTISVDNRSGVELAVPYYWNIAPNLDATLTPRIITRRGLGLDSEFRYLQPRYSGEMALSWLPSDRVAGRSREGLQWRHEGQGPFGSNYRADVYRVSDNDWWKDFGNTGGTLSARLLPQRLSIERPFALGLGTEPGQSLVYARWAQWQVLQSADSVIDAPYERTPQIGVQMRGQYSGLQWTMESEFNRFSLPSGPTPLAQRSGGDRAHLLGSLAWPLRQPGWWVVPRLAVNAAAYGQQTVGLGAQPSRAASQSRVIPSFSLDAGLELERSTTAFGRALYQTLEPRVLYVNTPFEAQSDLPNYDSAGKDFNFVSIYTDNSFTGVDRVSDAHQVTAGFTTRLVDVASGAEALRLGLVQRYLLRTQRVTAKADGSPDGDPLSQRFSDVLLVGSTSVLPGWSLSAALQYSPDIDRAVRTIASVSYSPGPFRTVSASYRLARGLSEQVELGWQWPLWGAGPDGKRAAAGSSSSCQGAWYAVGRLNYSLLDRRITDSVLGMEYDAGCWIGRFVAKQNSIGSSQASTRFLFQLEFVGLSRLGSNPLKVLKDNIPGYQLLRDDRSSPRLVSDPSLDIPPLHE